MKRKSGDDFDTENIEDEIEEDVRSKDLYRIRRWQRDEALRYLILHTIEVAVVLFKLHGMC